MHNKLPLLISTKTTKCLARRAAGWSPLAPHVPSNVSVLCREWAFGTDRPSEGLCFGSIWAPCERYFWQIALHASPKGLIHQKVSLYNPHEGWFGEVSSWSTFKCLIEGINGKMTPLLSWFIPSKYDPFCPVNANKTGGRRTKNCKILNIPYILQWDEHGQKPKCWRIVPFEYQIKNKNM